MGVRSSAEKAVEEKRTTELLDVTEARTDKRADKAARNSLKPVDTLERSRGVAAVRVRTPAESPAQKEAARGEFRTLMGMADFVTPFFDFTSIGIKDTRAFMTELLAEGYAARTPEQRQAIQTFIYSQAMRIMSGDLAPVMRELVGMFGPGWKKFMQLLSVRTDVVKSDEIRKEFTKATDENATLPLSDLHVVLQENLGPKWRELFSHIEEEAVNAGSVGQTHRAKLRRKGGADIDVHVKIQIPGAEQLGPDARLIRDTIRRLAPKSGQMLHCADALVMAAAQELDYKHEAQAGQEMVRVGINFGEVFPELSGKKVLVTATVPGENLGKAMPTLLRDAKRAKALGREYFAEVLRQIFSGHIFHADPSPGNVILTPKGELKFIDGGRTATLGDKGPLFQAVVETMLASSGKGQDIASHATEIAATLSWLFGYKSFSKEIATLVKSSTSFEDLLRRLTGDASLQVPDAMKQAFNTLIQAEGQAKLLDPTFTLQEAFSERGSKDASLDVLRTSVSRYIPSNLLDGKMLDALGIEGMSGQEFLTELIMDAFSHQSAKQRREAFAALADAYAKNANHDEMAVALLKQLGPGYVKLLQFLSSQAELVKDPKKLATLARLTDQAATVAFSELAPLLPKRSPLKIDPKPLFSGSLGQFHRGTLPDGTEVGVKFLKPGMRELLPKDFAALQKFFAAHAPKAVLIHEFLSDMTNIADDESDYEKELANTEKIKALRDGAELKVNFETPTAYAEYSNRDVLVTKLEHRLMKLDVAAKKGRSQTGTAYAALLEQILELGFFHADPSSGNVSARAGSGVPVFLDWGRASHLTAEESSALKDVMVVLLHDNDDVSPNFVWSISRPLSKQSQNAFNTIKKILGNAVDARVKSASKADLEDALAMARNAGRTDAVSAVQVLMRQWEALEPVLATKGFTARMKAVAKADLGLSKNVVRALEALVQLAGEEKKADPRFSVKDSFKRVFDVDAEYGEIRQSWQSNTLAQRQAAPPPEQVEPRQRNDRPKDIVGAYVDTVRGVAKAYVNFWTSLLGG